MSFYLHAFTLDEGKGKDPWAEIIVGPFEWVNLTWDFLRGGNEATDGDLDHQFLRADNGYWYCVAHVKTGERTGSMWPDYSRGRYSDIAILTEPHSDIAVIPTAVREVIGPTLTMQLELAKETEDEWIRGYDG